VNLFGPINRLGMGIHFVNWAAKLIPLLQESGYNIYVHPKGPIDLDRGNLSSAERLVLSHTNPQDFAHDLLSIDLWHLTQVADFAGSPRVLYTVFETDRLKPEERINLDKVDLLIVPTQWHKSILLRDERVPEERVGVVHEGIDPQVFNPIGGQGQPWVIEGPNDEIRFVSVGKFEKRKGIEPMVDALLMAAPKVKRPIRLIAHWANPFTPDWFQQVSNLLTSRGFSRNSPPSPSLPIIQFTSNNLTIDVVVSGFQSHANLATLYHSAHWILYPSFAEGWGLPLHEALACGVPAICQHYSGMTEYLPEGGYLAVYGKLVVAQDGRFFHGKQGRWSQVDTQSLAQCIKHACNMDKDEYKIKSMAAERAGQFTWEESAKQTIGVLKRAGYIQ
jgi:glycosyltransferase involved in cell wall biosynthesis